MYIFNIESIFMGLEVGILMWETLSRDDVLEIIKIDKDISKGLKGHSSLGSFLGKALHFYEQPGRNFIMLDLYYFMIRFSLDHDYYPEQISVLVSILTRVHNFCISTHFENFSRAKYYLNQLLLVHSVNHVPFSIALFTTCQYISMLNYFTLTYFAHYHLYKYVFTKNPILKLSLLNIDNQLNLENTTNVQLPKEVGSKLSLLSTKNVTDGIDFSYDAEKRYGDTLDAEGHDIIGIFSIALKSKMDVLKLQLFEQINERGYIIEEKLSILEKSLHFPLNKN